MSGSTGETQPSFDASGLIPVVVQHHATGQVLMVAFADAGALEKTRASGWLHLYSRSRKALWLKGETSGNRMKIRELTLDCDRDALVAKVEPQGPACHTGELSCFFHPLEAPGAGPGPLDPAPGGDPPGSVAVLAKLLEVLKDRQRNPRVKSYTSYLFEQGIDKILKKVGEEATEVVIAAKNGDRPILVSESADLIYHLLVLFVERGVDLCLLYGELEKRSGAPRREKE